MSDMVQSFLLSALPTFTKKNKFRLTFLSKNVLLDEHICRTSIQFACREIERNALTSMLLRESRQNNKNKFNSFSCGNFAFEDKARQHINKAL